MGLDRCGLLGDLQDVTRMLFNPRRMNAVGTDRLALHLRLYFKAEQSRHVMAIQNGLSRFPQRRISAEGSMPTSRGRSTFRSAWACFSRSRTPRCAASAKAFERTTNTRSVHWTIGRFVSAGGSHVSSRVY